MEEYAIKINNISKIYRLYNKPVDRLKEALSVTKKNYHRNFTALNDVSFDVKKGECVGIMGVNGAGKSTILKIITGVLNPTGGSIDINGKISALLELGAGFNADYTGMENIYLNGTLMGYSEKEIDDRVQEILDFADIGDYINQPVKTYSSGMFVRLAFAVAINIDPEILIVDEALSVGDVFFQAKCYKKFEEFKKQGKTILLVSHSLSSILKYCDKVVLLDKGSKLAEGEPAAMIDLYKKILVNQNEDIEEESDDSSGNAEFDSSKLWKNKMVINPNINSYGTGDADIIDFGLFDNKGLITNQITKGDDFTVKMRVKFNSKIEDPICAFTIVNLHGTDITGTNTMFEKCNTGTLNAGEILEAEFTQKMDLQGGHYLISLGCTGYQNGEFTVYHRLYEVTNLYVISERNTVGFYDMNSKAKVKKLS